MHQKSHQDAGHCHQNGVVVHTLQACGEGRKGVSLERAPAAGAPALPSILPTDS